MTAWRTGSGPQVASRREGEGVTSGLQSITDELSHRAGVAVVIDDPDLRTVAHSNQLGPIDSLRRDSILNRAISPAATEWLSSFGIYRSARPVKIPASPHLDILPRVCIPVRYRDQLLGFLWLIDPFDAISAADLEAAQRAAEHAGLMLYEERLEARLAGQALAHLLSTSEELREAAAGLLVSQSLLREGEPVAAVVVQAAPDGAPTGVPIEDALLDIGWDAPAGSFLRLAQDDHGVALVRLRSQDDDHSVTSLASACRERLHRRLSEAGRGAVRVVAGVGDSQTDLMRAAASYRQARLAVTVAVAMPTMGDVVRWSDLGVFRVLSQLPNRETMTSAIDPRVEAVLALGDTALVETLETYLDLAGDAKATTEHLHLHRATLYYRLEKARRVAGIDMHNGYDRLAVHLGLKLARLAGRHGTGRPPDPLRPAS